MDKKRILDEFVAITGYHRKHAVRLLGRSQCRASTPVHAVGSRRIYDEAVKEALIVLWEASDRICGKRLKAILPELLDAMERHGHVCLDSEVRNRMLKVSASTMDRLLRPVRNKGRARKKRRRSARINKEIPVRTFADWGQPDPGYLEIDMVVHCGGSVGGSCLHTLVATDVCSGWTESILLLAREQSLSLRPQQGLQRFGEVAGADALEVKPWDQFLNALRPPQIRRQNATGKPHGIRLVLEASDNVVCVSDHDHVASGISLTPLIRPQVKHVMKMDVCQQR